MVNFKSFLLGMLTAYGVYYLTRKRPDGKSTLDDLLENPEAYLKYFKIGLLQDAGRVLREIVE